MPSFHSISSFRKTVSKLLASKKDGYGSAWMDIVKDFKGKQIDEIRQFREMIKIGENYKLIKHRVTNSESRLSGKDGYRLVFLVRNDIDDVIFLHVFPKRGKFGVSNISEKIYIALLLEYEKEKNSGTLFEYSDFE